MRWKRPPRAVSTSRPVDRVASATSSMVMVEPIKVAISPLHAALASDKSVTSIASRSNDEGAVTGQRCPPTMACSVVLGCHDRGKPSACPTETSQPPPLRFCVDEALSRRHVADMHDACSQFDDGKHRIG